MLRVNPFFDAKIENEVNCSKHINILNHYDDETLIDKAGKLIKVIKLKGLDSFTESELTLDQLKHRLNNLFKNISSNFAIYFWEIRRRDITYPEGEFNESYASEVNEKYKAAIKESPFYSNELYLAIMTKPPEGYINKGFDFIKQLNLKLDKEAKANYLKNQHQALETLTIKFLNALEIYQPELLRCYEKNGKQCSAILEFLSQLINADTHVVPANVAADQLLPRKRLFFNRRTGTIEIRAANGSSKFAAILSIKGYQPFTYQGFLNKLSHLPIEYTLTQSFRFYDNPVAKRKFREQQKELMQSPEESLKQTAEISDVYDETASGELGYGAHHFSLLCFADSIDELNNHIGTLTAFFSNIDITSVREDIAAECTFWAQLPGNFGYVLRTAPISTKNLASFISLHNATKRKLKGNHWGNAVTVFETLSGSPYYFNFHYKDVGNFLVFGSMGSGKTVIVGFLILQSMKFGGKRIIFDKDRGLEILVRAMGGIYENIKPGIATGFNPCQLEDNAENRKFLSYLFKNILKPKNDVELERIEQVIDSMYRLEKRDRQFCYLATLFGTKKPGNLRARFDEWHSEGPYAWVFDNEKDSLDLNSQVLGFDLSHILKDQDCKTAALMYLTYRIEQTIIGERAILFCDEGFHALSDDYFKQLFNDWSRTPRKKNNIFGLATQVANDTIADDISKAIHENAFCKIFFPNSAADRKVYVQDFGLTEREYELIKTLPDNEHYFLLKFGRNAAKESVVIRANLAKLQDEIAIISAREESLLLLDQIRKDVGDDPEKWLPIFHAKRKGKLHD